MYNILLTDDEQIVIDSLKFIIEKNFPGQTEIFTAQSGTEAINICRGFKIDIAFMDISMPGLNGLEAISEIKHFNPSILIIILSAFDRFQYAREALDLGVHKYLTKPVNRNLIAQTVRNAMNVVDSVHGRMSSEIELRERLNSVSSIVESDFIYSCIFAADEDRDLSSYLDFFNITRTSFFFCTVEIPRITPQSRYPVYLQLRELLSANIECIIGPVMMNRVVIFFPVEESGDDTADTVRALSVIRSLYNQFAVRIGSDIRIGMSRIEHSLSRTAAAYNESLAALPSSGSGVFFAGASNDASPAGDAGIGALQQKLLARIQAGDLQGIRHQFVLYAGVLNGEYADRPDVIKNLFFEVLVLARRTATEAKASFDNTALFLETWATLSRLVPGPELENYVLDRLAEYARVVFESRTAKTNPVIEKAEQYIAHNLSSSISLEDTAHVVKVNPFYLSKLFKEETGQNFIDYLTNARMGKARELLKDTSLSIKEISHETGYPDQNYFSKLFKKNFGFTPTEFRDSFLTGGTDA